MIQIEPVKRLTVTEQIMEQIAQLITNGHLEPGAQLPNERELAERFSVTRGRVREALRALALIGLITIKAGEGSFVNKQEEPIPSDTIAWMFHREKHNLDEVYAARQLIETEVYLSAAGQLTEEELALLDKKLAHLSASVHMDADAFLQLLDDFDLRIGERSDNRIFNKLMQMSIHLRRETSLKLLRVPGAKENSVKQRSAILAALTSRDKKQLHAALKGLFTSSKQFYANIMKTD
ncbi:FadR/GntR family transcriptional regulator [Paenibacillus sp. BC26]|uniref:FadR/GntR family transcriptional regulator n=1 Tax=Paenibacillus sp. BC26 TaxID=1881032 RepID=UPI0008F15F7F|nr:GntR family transcriptional regulator [Paenibacillus sp. BC26]SFS71877.1 DNA-binding transcriptional regulator, FadR family [Paenibacillus sp. BC26]